MERVIRFLRDEEGAVGVEYGLILGLIGLVIAAGALTIGGYLETIFTEIGTALEEAVGGE